MTDEGADSSPEPRVVHSTKQQNDKQSTAKLRYPSKLSSPARSPSSEPTPPISAQEKSMPPEDHIQNTPSVVVGQDSVPPTTAEPHLSTAGGNTASNTTAKASANSTPSQEDPTDPIESADELRLSRAGIPSDDPIEADGLGKSVYSNALPPGSTPKPGAARRMKNRNGKILDDESQLPILGSELLAQSTPAPTKKRTNKKAPSSAVEPEMTGRATRRITTSSSMPPPPPTAPDPPVKRRGRQPLSAEEKTRRDAEKQAERDRKAAEKAAEKEAKAAERRRIAQEKAAEKEAKAAERKAKAAAKAAEKEEKARSKSQPKKGSVRAASTSTRDSGETSNSATSLPSSQPVVPHLTQATQNPNISIVQWETLSQSKENAADVIEPESPIAPESSLVDQLRSSSPELDANNTVNTVKLNKSTVNGFSHAGKTPRQLNNVSSDIRTPQRDDNDPLFLPGTQMQSQQHDLSFDFPSQARPSSPTASESSQDEEEPVPKQPARYPAKTWTQNSRFPRLSDISSQAFLSPLPTPTSSFPLRPAGSQLGSQKSINADDDDDDDDDDESSESSDDDDDEKSHIPKERRAGITVQKKNKAGLLSHA